MGWLIRAKRAKLTEQAKPEKTPKPRRGAGGWLFRAAGLALGVFALGKALVGEKKMCGACGRLLGESRDEVSAIPFAPGERADFEFRLEEKARLLEEGNEKLAAALREVDRLSRALADREAGEKQNEEKGEPEEESRAEEESQAGETSREAAGPGIPDTMPDIPEISDISDIPKIPAIPGIDAAKGIAAAGGSAEAYRRNLGAFRAGAAEKTRRIKLSLAERDYRLFAAHAGALGAAAAGAGADSLRALASELEDAGLCGDAEFIAGNAAEFISDLEALANAVGEFLGGDADPLDSLDPPASPGPSDSGSSIAEAGGGALEEPGPEEPAFGLLREMLGRLNKAMQEFDMAAVGGLLGELESCAGLPLVGEQLKRIRHDAAIGEYDEAEELIDELLGVLDKLEMTEN